MPSPRLSAAAVLLLVPIVHGQVLPFGNSNRDLVRVDSIDGSTVNLGLARDRAPLRPAGVPDDVRVITFDVRALRGGHGDVAAAYLTARELIHRLRFTGRIVFVTIAKTRGVLSTLVGEPVRAGGVLPGQIDVVDGFGIPAALPPADLLITLAAKWGEPPRADRVRNVDLDGHGHAPDRIPVHAGTVQIVAPVFAAAEGTLRWQKRTYVRYRGVDFTAPPPGTAATEAGLYHDDVATALGKHDAPGIRRAVRAAIARRRPSPIFDRLDELLRADDGRALGFAYGLSHAAVKKQFGTYLRGLLDSGPRALTLLTPSEVTDSDVAEFADRGVRVFNLTDPIDPKIRIAVIRLPAVPHDVFTGLLALSAVPPIISGDAALSAARALGRPFVMTQVKWNQPIARDLFLDFYTTAPDPAVAWALKLVARGDLSQASVLKDARGVFAAPSPAEPTFADVVLLAAARARRFVDVDARGLTQRQLLCSNNDVLNFRVGARQLSEGRGPFDAAALDQVLHAGYRGMLARKALSSADLRDETLRRPLLEFMNGTINRRKGRFEEIIDLWAIDGGRLAELDDVLRAAGETCAPLADSLDTDAGYGAVVDAERVINALGTIWGDDALALVARRGLDFPFRSTRLLAFATYANHLAARGDAAAVEDLLSRLDENDLSWFAQIIFKPDSPQPWPAVVRATLKLIAPDHYYVKYLRAKLADVTEDGGCEALLARRSA